jgi:hypothetical protein
MGLSDAFTRSKLVQTYALHFILIVIAAPMIEGSISLASCRRECLKNWGGADLTCTACCSLYTIHDHRGCSSLAHWHYYP